MNQNSPTAGDWVYLIGGIVIVVVMLAALWRGHRSFINFGRTIEAARKKIGEP
jgi:hypothetical protein